MFSSTCRIKRSKSLSWELRKMRRQCDVALSELARMSRYLAISDFSVCANLLEKPELMNSKKSLKNHLLVVKI